VRTRIILQRRLLDPNTILSKTEPVRPVFAPLEKQYFAPRQYESKIKHLQELQANQEKNPLATRMATSFDTQREHRP